MEQIRIDLKIFAASNQAPPTDALIRVFHRWIQTSRLDELMLDVADYSHVHQGPGVLLLCHGSHYALDAGNGELGLLYSRRRRRLEETESPTPAPDPSTPLGDLEDRLANVFHSALEACRALEEEADLAGQLQFPGDHFHLVINNRWSEQQSAFRSQLQGSGLQGPLEGKLLAFLRRLFPSGQVTLEPLEESRVAFEIRADRTPGAAVLLERLATSPEPSPASNFPLAEAVGQ